jgi:hypothetical protein
VAQLQPLQIGENAQYNEHYFFAPLLLNIRFCPGKSTEQASTNSETAGHFTRGVAILGDSS